MRSRWATVLVGIMSAFLGVATSTCDRQGQMSVVPPFDLCCWCLATHETKRGARCSRGSVTDCIQDLERLDVQGSESNLRCFRDVCHYECAFLIPFLPKQSATTNCCDCLAASRQDGVACYQGTSDECATEIDEGDLNKLLQGGAICTQGVCQQQCAALFGAPPDAGVEDAGPQPDGGADDGGMMSSSSSSGSSGTVTQDGGPHLPWDGGCPLNFPCF